MNEFHREDWFMAQLAYHVFVLPYRVWGAKIPKDVKIEDFLIKFGSSNKAEPKEMTEEDKEKDRKQRAEMMKSVFFAFTGLDAEGKKQKDPPKVKKEPVKMTRTRQLPKPRPR